MSRPSRPKHPRRVLKMKRLLVVLGVLVGVAGVGTAAYVVQYGRQSNQWADLAREAAQKKDYPRAKELYEHYLTFRPKDAAGVRFELAAVYDDYARGSLSNPGQAWRLWAEAKRNYNLALSDDPNRPEERRKLAKLYLLLGETEPARKEIELVRASPQFHDDPELYEMLAACDDGTGPKSREAVAGHLRAAVNTGKAPPEMYLRLAFLLKRDIATPQAQEEAEQVISRMVDDKKDNLFARLARARYYAEFGRRTLAREDVKFAYEHIPGGRENVDVILAHAEAVAADNLVEARAILERGVKANPDSALLGMGLAEVDSRGGNRAKAREQLTAVFARLPAGDPLALEVGDRLLDLGDTATAGKAADALDGNPDVQPLAGYLRGRVKLAQGDWPAALPLLQQAVLAIEASRVVKRKPPLLHKTHMALAAAYGLAKDTEKEEDEYHRAAKADETSVAARVAWADALSRLNRTADAVKVYSDVLPNSPAARVAVATLKLQEAMTAVGAGGGPRRLNAFWLHVGPGPYPPELAPTVAAALAAEGKADEGVKVLQKAVGEKPTVAAYSMLAALQASKGKDAALAVLKDADDRLGVTADIQLARAAVLAREPKPDTAALAALATNDKVPAADRGRLKLAVGELLLSLGAADVGVPLLEQAAAEQPFDLNVRVVLFDWALVKKNPGLRDRMLAEIHTLDTARTATDPAAAKGGIALVAEVMHELADTPKPTREANERMSAKLTAAEKKRRGWSRIPRMQGILAAAAGKSDEAARFYEQAVTLGDHSDAIVRELVRLYFRKELYGDARRVLQTVRQKGPLSPELEQQYQVLLSVADGDPKRALNRALSPEMKDSTSYHDHVLRAQVLARFGNEDEAKKALDAALKLAPAVPDVYVAKLRVLLMLGHTADKLRPEIEAAAKVLRSGNPANPAAVAGALGQMWEMVGDTPAAITEYTAAMTAAPTDRDAPALLLAVYRRTNDTTAAEGLLSKAAASADADLRRWAKRQQAGALLAGPDAIRSVPKAVKLLDENIAEGDRIEDKRARAFALCADPLQRTAGLDALHMTREREPLAADDAFKLAGILIQGAHFDDAEKELAAATAGGLLADPAHLVLLAQVQAVRNDPVAAGRTVARLKTIAPKRADVILAEARLLAKGDPAKAAELVLAIPTPETDARKPLQQARWLEAVGCVSAADKATDEFFRGAAPLADRVTEAADFYTRTGRGDKALSVVKGVVGNKDVPPEVIGRLMVAAVRQRPKSTAPDADKAAWAARVEEVTKYVNERERATPTGEWALWQAELADIAGVRVNAISGYKTAHERFATNPFGRAVAQNNWLTVRLFDGREGSAEMLQQINEVIADVGPQPFALDTRGVVRLFMNKAADALPDLEAAAGYAASATNLFHLAQCYRKLGREADAKGALERAKLMGLTRDSLHPLEGRDYDALVK